MAIPATVRLTRDARKIGLLAAGFFFVFGFSNISYFLPLYYEQTGFASPRAAGVLVGAFYFASIVFRPLMGNLVARIGFRRTFYAAGIIGVLSSVGVALPTTRFAPAFVSRCALGLSSSLFLIGLSTYQAVAFTQEERGRAYSLIAAGGLLPMMTMVPIADFILRQGWNQAYIALPGLACLGAALITPRIPNLEEYSPAKQGARGNLLDCIRIAPLRSALYGILLFSFTDAAAAFMGAMTVSRGMAASLFLSSNAVVGVIARVFFVRVIDRYPRRILARAATVVTASTLLAATAAPSGKWLVALGTLYGVGMGFGFPMHQAHVSDCATRELQPQAASLSWFLMACGFAFVPLLSGILSQYVGPVTALRLIAAPTLILTLLTFLPRGMLRKN